MSKLVVEHFMSLPTNLPHSRHINITLRYKKVDMALYLNLGKSLWPPTNTLHLLGAEVGIIPLNFTMIIGIHIG